MTTSRPDPHAPTAPAGLPHATHDEVLIARLAADDLGPADAEGARQLVASCPDCARLEADLRAIARSLATLPNARRERDFRLTAEQARELRQGWLARWMERARRQHLVVLQPLAGAAVAVGLVMAIVSSGPLPGLSVATSPTGENKAQTSAEVPMFGAVPNATGGAAMDQSAASAGSAAGAAGERGPIGTAAPQSQTAGPVPPSPPPPLATELPGESPPNVLAALPYPSGPVPLAASSSAAPDMAAVAGAAPSGAPVPPGAEAGAGGGTPQLHAATEPAGGSQGLATWQLGLLIAACGGLVLLAVRVALRRAEIR